MENADDIVGIVSPERYPCVGAFDDLFDDLARRQVGVHHFKIPAVVHYLADINVGQIEYATQHDAFLANCRSISLM
jgi:hypothetical protein